MLEKLKLPYNGIQNVFEWYRVRRLSLEHRVQCWHGMRVVVVVVFLAGSRDCQDVTTTPGSCCRCCCRIFGWDPPIGPRFVDGDGMLRPVLTVGCYHAHPLDDAHATVDPTKDSVFAIEPRRRFECDEELAFIRVRARVGHAQYARPRVFEVPGDLILKGPAVDALPPTARSRWVSTLNEDVTGDPMERHPVVVPRIG